MARLAPETEKEGMSFLEHLDELRSRLFRSAIAYVVLLALSWGLSDRVLKFLMVPFERHLGPRGDLVFLTPTEPFFVYLKASAVLALFVAMPYLLWQIWAFVSPGLHAHERRLAVPFLVFGTGFFVAGAAFAYYVALPLSIAWLLGLGSQFRAALTLQAAFGFETRVVLAMGLVFELPIVIFFLARIGLVTPQFLWRHLRHAVVLIAILAAVITPSGDMLTMSVFGGPMILLYLLGILIAQLFGKPRRAA
jgi:sec-independent protein translocase protein TatC